MFANSTNNQDFLPLEAIDHVEFYVGNARQAAQFYRSVYGFTIMAYQGLETGVRDRTSYLLTQGNIKFVVTGALDSDSEIAAHVKEHGDGVKDICFRVRDVDQIHTELIKRGAKSVLAPTSYEDNFGSVRQASIAIYGDTTHSFISRTDYIGPFLPGYHALENASYTPSTLNTPNLAAIDHMVANVGWGEMDYWVNFYKEVMGFSQLVSFDDKDISTDYSALMSKVMQNSTGRIKLPINEPAHGRKQSQIEEFLNYYKGPGIQHLALATGNILQTVAELKARGVEFIQIPDSYYQDLEKRVGQIKEPLAEVRRLGLLVDRDDEGYLLQTFTRPVADRPTFFFEIIQRHHARSFGKGNFKALFEAIEHDQALRGNL
jgi:4-hydroxyphenylpyruvate dioxygenase